MCPPPPINQRINSVEAPLFEKILFFTYITVEITFMEISITCDFIAHLDLYLQRKLYFD